MIITRTPYRISLFGGGTDYPTWYHEHGGSVVGFAINRYNYLTIRRLPPFFEHKHRIVYSRIETVREIDEIEHPAVRAVFSELGVRDGVELHYDGDLPSRSGLGSSSSFTVGLINALHAMRGRLISKRDLASEAIRIEQDVIGEAVGSQDQTWAAYGGLNRINFLQDGQISVNPLVLTPGRQRDLMSRFMLFFTGLSRLSTVVAKEKIGNLNKRSADLHHLQDLVDEAINIIVGGSSIDDLGNMLHESWMIKKGLAESVTTTLVDEIYEKARDAGAIGGKLIGAGGGGFMLLYVEPEKQQFVREALKGLIEVTFDIDRAGSSVIVYEPNGLENC
ncbi:kinase [Nisaea sp.]|uniref:GHMP family kinase ATP-binding protein n=1 Tax=Nisaea sp. TaxID=2024842 RepID=UPI003B519BA9